MSNKPQKKKLRFLTPVVDSIQDGWRSLRSRSPSSSNPAQALSGASVPSGASLPLTSNPPAPTEHIQLATPSVSENQAGSLKSDQPSSYPAKDYAKTTLSGAYELLKVIKESSDVFIPLKSVVGGVVACVNAYKQTSGNHEEMERILKSIDQLASALAARLKESKDHKSLDQIIKRLTTSLEEEDKKIKVMHQRGFVVRLAHNSDDGDELVSSCQAIKDALDIFYVGLTLLVERNTRDILKNVMFQALPRSRDAAFSAAINVVNVSRGPCTEGTRVDIIEQIMGWVKETDPMKAPPIYWLNGLAGLGKTTIAYTICELLEKAEIPFASFFCSLQLDSKNSKLLITTLCRDLSELFSSYASEVLPVLECNSKIVDAGLSRQMEQLLAKPWQTSLTHRDCLQVPIVIVDALDECDCGTDFLQELLRIVESGKLTGIKFLVTSRPEPRLVDLCKSFPENAVCKLHEVDISNVQRDIERYLCEALPDLKDEADLLELAQQAGGFFIYATTAVRFISPPSPHPSFSAHEKLSQLRNMLSSWPMSSRPGRPLVVDELYQQILGVAFDFADDSIQSKRLQILHTVLCAQSRIDVSILADLNNTDQDTVQKVVESLYAVLFISSKDDCVYWYHASFPDFVFTQARSKFTIFSQPNYPSYNIDVFCDASAHHAFLASQCFSIMQDLLHFNICDLKSSYMFDSEVPYLSDQVQRNITSTLQYASQHWAGHLLQAPSAENETNDLFLQLHNFICNKLLFWIEAMNLIKVAYKCSPLLKEAEDWLKRGQLQPDLLEYLADAANFSVTFANSPAAKSTPHLYISTLSTWQQSSPVWTHWKHRFTFIPSISLSKSIISPLMTISTNGRIKCIALSENNSQITIASLDESVQVWDAKKGLQLRKLQGHTGNATSVALSSDGSQIVFGFDDNSIQLWDVKTGKKLKELQGHTSVITLVAYSPNGNQIISASDNHVVQIWDINAGIQLSKLQGHTGKVTSVAFSPDGNQIASSSWGQPLQVWNARTGKLLKKLRLDIDIPPESVVFSPDANQIVSGSINSIYVWDANTGELLRKFEGHSGSISSVAFSSNGNHIISGSWDKSVRMWNAKTGELLKKLQGHTSTVTSVAFSFDGNQIISASDDKSVQVWNAKTEKQLNELQGHASSVTSVVFSSDGKEIVSSSRDNSVQMWNANTGEQIRKLQGNTKSVTLIIFSPDGNQIASGSLDGSFVGSIQIWDAKTGKHLNELQNYHYTGLSSFSFSSDSKQIISVGIPSSMQVWDAKTGKLLQVLKNKREHYYFKAISSVAFLSDKNQIAFSSDNNSVELWDIKSGTQLKELQGHTEEVTSVTFSPDGNQIVSGSGDNSVRVWNAKTGKLLKELQGHTMTVVSVAFSSDGNKIVSGSWDSSICMWNVNTEELLRKFQGHTEVVNSVAFSPDGNQIVSGSNDYSVRVWDAKIAEQPRKLQDHTGAKVISDLENQSTNVLSNLDLDHSWAMNKDGWIISNTKRLIWIPATIHNILRHPYNTLIISQNGYATISFANSKLGPLWHECYTP